MKKPWLSTLARAAIGAAIGAIGACVLGIFGLCIEIISCGCDILAFSCNHKDVFHWSSYKMFFLICVIGGAVVGAIYGIYKAKEEADKIAAQKFAEKLAQEREYRIRQAETLKQKALNVHEICKRNSDDIKPLVSVTYATGKEMEVIMRELLKISETRGKMEAMVEEITENSTKK